MTGRRDGREKDPDRRGGRLPRPESRYGGASGWNAPSRNLGALVGPLLAAVVASLLHPGCRVMPDPASHRHATLRADIPRSASPRSAIDTPAGGSDS